MVATTGVRLDEDQMPPPVATEGADHDPKELVPSAEPRPLSRGPTQDGELLAEEQVLGH